MAQKNPSRSLVTPEFRMSFPHLITAHPYTENGKPTGKEAYQVEGIFEEPAMNAFKMYDEQQGKYIDVNLPQILVSLGKEAWPDLKNPMTGEPETIKQLFERQGGKGWPIKLGNVRKAEQEGKGKKGDQYADKRVINFKSNKADNIQPPVLSHATGAKTYKVLERVSDADMSKAKLLFQGGNYAFATIGVVAMTVSGTKFLTPYLNGIRYTREGQKFGGTSEMDRFDGVSGGASDHNPTDGMDDEIPF